MKCPGLDGRGSKVLLAEACLVSLFVLSAAHAVSADSPLASVSVGGGPYGIAFDSTNGDIYVTDLGTSTVSVISGSTNAVVATVPLGTSTSSRGIAFDSASGDLYVTNYNPSTVSVISGSTNAVLGYVQLANGTGPFAASFDSTNGDVYVAGYSTDVVWIIPQGFTLSTATGLVSSASSTSTSSSTGSAVPEFPYSALLAAVFVLVMVSAYLGVRRLSTRTQPRRV